MFALSEQFWTVSPTIASAMNHSLLTKEEEFYHGTQVQRAARLHSIHDRLLPGPVSDESWARAADLGVDELRAAIALGEASRETLVLRNLRLVAKYADPYCNANRAVPAAMRGQISRMSKDELIAEGVIGLIRAVNKYDPTRGFRFATYATWWVKQQLSSASRKSAMIKIPTQLAADHASITRTLAQEAEIEGRPTEVRASDAQITAAGEGMGLSPKQSLRAYNGGPVSIVAYDKAAYNNEEGHGAVSWISGMQAETLDPEEVAVYGNLRGVLGELLLSQLTDFERDIVRMRMGLDSRRADPLSWKLVREQIGKDLVAESYIKGVYRTAMKKLRRADLGEIQEFLGPAFEIPGELGAERV